jgi:AcrR family transcriptional regulator
LEAADRLFEQNGVRAVGVEAIATAAGTNKMTLYRCFRSKDELVAAWLEGVLARWRDLWRSIEDLSDDRPTVMARQLLRLLGDGFEQHGVRAWRLLAIATELPEADHPARRAFAAYKASCRRSLTGILERIGVRRPAQAADEILLVAEGALAGIPDSSVARSQRRFTNLARSLLLARVRELSDASAATHGSSLNRVRKRAPRRGVERDQTAAQ